MGWMKILLVGDAAIELAEDLASALDGGLASVWDVLSSGSKWNFC